MTTEIISTQSETSSPAPPNYYRLSVDQYHQMVAEGILTENDRIQLLEGVLLTMPAMGTRHVICVKLINQFLTALLPENWHIGIQQPVTMEASEPEPDLAVIRGAIRDYTQHHPSGSDVGLVIEVADTSPQMDRGQKLSIYARTGIPEYWIVNLNENTIEVYRDPLPEKSDYSSKQVIAVSDSFSITLAEQPLGELKASDLLP